MNKYLILLVAIIGLFTLTSCKKKAEILITDGEVVPLSAIGNDIYDLDSKTQTWHQAEGVICILYGYGYNDKDFVLSSTQSLYEEYGDASEGGYIYPLVFPDDFKHGQKVFITLLEDRLEDKEVKGIILLGAPENTSTALARMQDKNGGRLNYPVLSFFSQDDVTAMEDSVDFLLDKEQNSDSTREEEVQTRLEEIDALLSRAVRYEINSPSPFKKEAALINIVKEVAEGLNIERYMDAQSSLVSINHFVIK